MFYRKMLKTLPKRAKNKQNEACFWGYVVVFLYIPHNWRPFGKNAGDLEELLGKSVEKSAYAGLVSKFGGGVPGRGKGSPDRIR